MKSVCHGAALIHDNLHAAYLRRAPRGLIASLDIFMIFGEHRVRGLVFQGPEGEGPVSEAPRGRCQRLLGMSAQKYQLWVLKCKWPRCKEYNL